MSAEQSNKAPIKRAEEALRSIAVGIEYDADTTTTDGEETVLRGLSAMASALIQLRGLDLGPAAPLDLVLTEIGADKELVNAVAEIIELIGRSSYTGGLTREQAEEAEDLRQFIYDRLDDLRQSLEPGEAHG